MPIQFIVSNDKRYFTATWQGLVTGEEMLELYLPFLEGPLWRPGMNELTNLENVQWGDFTFNEIKNLWSYGLRHLEDHNVTMKTALYAPFPMPFGISKTYESLSDGSSEHVRVFQELEVAVKWLTDGSPVLTNRESEVLMILANGGRNKDIAAELYISPNTVRFHVQHLFEKLDVRTRGELIRVATQHGFLAL